MYNMSPYSLSRSFRDKPCRAVIYGRASTEHEAQVKALQNQMQWYDDVARFHPQWNVINRYIDQGITGTQVYKRDAFMRMMEDAKQQKFDLIVTREVCRFARNTVDALVCVRQLAAIGIEVYFVNDNIWTLDGDGELRLTIILLLSPHWSITTNLSRPLTRKKLSVRTSSCPLTCRKMLLAAMKSARWKWTTSIPRKNRTKKSKQPCPHTTTKNPSRTMVVT